MVGGRWEFARIEAHALASLVRAQWGSNAKVEPAIKEALRFQAYQPNAPTFSNGEEPGAKVLALRVQQWHDKQRARENGIAWRANHVVVKQHHPRSVAVKAYHHQHVEQTPFVRIDMAAFKVT